MPKYDINDLYVSEISKYQTLILLGANRSSSSGTYTSPSSGLSYTYTNETDLMTQLGNFLLPYRITASDYNDIYTNMGNMALVMIDNMDTTRSYIQKGSLTYGISSNGTDAYTITLSSTPTLAYTSGMTVNIKVDVGNVGSASLNINGLGAKAIKKITIGGLVDLETGDMVANGFYTLYYEGTYFILNNPTSIYASMLSAMGDIPYASNANTPARLPLGASGKAVMSNGNNVVYGYPDVPTYQASDNAILTTNTTFSGINQTTWYPTKTFMVKYSGIVKVKFDISSGSSGFPAYLAVTSTDMVDTATASKAIVYTSPNNNLSYTSDSFSMYVVGGQRYTIFIRNASGYLSSIKNITICADVSTGTLGNAIS